ncbi:hypothetical protein M438DRAFT_46985 [Aureobasidium pullulans EXF-150]|uniref:Uncharacterized protein n=1 Tax=Aureobasidium pullulans EXF-150 TaxID=1043002 RepID=A0A074Y798_AURPU|nr:uncharacterized protein M438DRAFT_46985 [Aureobasidium pullulans EXF-150]KEQ82756.1 hypothetical protein M438DRAFT_46985 [Aureobasidium pullulans EXF-150]
MCTLVPSSCMLDRSFCFWIAASAYMNAPFLFLQSLLPPPMRSSYRQCLRSGSSATLNEIDVSRPKATDEKCLRGNFSSCDFVYIQMYALRS